MGPARGAALQAQLAPCRGEPVRALVAVVDGNRLRDPGLGVLAHSYALTIIALAACGPSQPVDMPTAVFGAWRGVPSYSRRTWRTSSITLFMPCVYPSDC